MTEEVQEKLQDLPISPGVYFHKDAKGEIIYVGKAAVLKNRVRQYFQKSRDRDPKTEALVKEIADIEWLEVESEIDALFLEAELIKRYKPRYNIMLRDDRSNLFVKINIKSDHPIVQFVRRPMDDGAEYFGPFLSGWQVKKALKYLRRVFPYDLKKPSGQRVSLDYHIGLSPGLEAGKSTMKDYKTNLRKLMMYLRGERSKLVRSIEIEMQKAAKNKEFERAALLRNQVTALKELNRQIIFSDREFMDISKDQALNGLTELLELKGQPHRIEGYDISHHSGTDTVASMVVFTNGIPDKTEYRKFKMRIPGNDDFAHMNEVIMRRFSGKHLEEWPKPDLLLIDGGKGQLSSALKALKQRGVDIPVISLAKRQETIIRVKDSNTDRDSPNKDGSTSNSAFKSPQLEELQLPKTSHIVKLLQRIRDESHRFAISYHSSLKIKRQTASLLDEIPTIGPATRKKLIKEFGSMRGVMQARTIELQKVVGEKKTIVLKQYLRPLKKEQKDPSNLIKGLD